MVLGNCYESCGTEVVYMVLRTCYGACGMEMAYAATLRHNSSSTVEKFPSGLSLRDTRMGLPYASRACAYAVRVSRTSISRLFSEVD